MRAKCGQLACVRTVERHNDQGRSGRQRDIFRKIKIDAAANPPLSHIRLERRAVVELDVLEVVRTDAPARIGRIVHDLADNNRANPGARVLDAERDVDHRIERSVGVGPSAERLAVGDRAELDVIDESCQSAEGVGLQEPNIIAVGRTQCKVVRSA